MKVSIYDQKPKSWLTTSYRIAGGLARGFILLAFFVALSLAEIVAFMP